MTSSIVSGNGASGLKKQANELSAAPAPESSTHFTRPGGLAEGSRFPIVVRWGLTGIGMPLDFVSRVGAASNCRKSRRATRLRCQGRPGPSGHRPRVSWESHRCPASPNQQAQVGSAGPDTVRSAMSEIAQVSVALPPVRTDRGRADLPTFRTSATWVFATRWHGYCHIPLVSVSQHS